MRWSQIAVITCVFVSGFVSALPTDLNVRSDIDSAETQLFARKLKSKDIKESSQDIRNKALTHGFQYDKGKRGVKKQTITAMPSSHYQADHVLEAQTVIKALHNAGHKRLKVAQKNAVITALNHPDNLVHLHHEINAEKNHYTNAVNNGRSHVPTTQLKDYMRKTKANGLNAATAVDAALKQHGIHNVNVHALHTAALAHAGIHRREFLDVDDY